MSRPDGLYQWTDTLRAALPHLSKPQATVLAVWSFGMVLARSCALTAVVTVMAPLLDLKANTLRQQLREWCYDADDKRGDQRRALEVEACFAPLLQWVVSLWHGQQLALALDATSLGTRFVVLAISVVYRGCAVPVAWCVLPAAQRGAWRPDWLRLLRRVWRAVPRDWFVIVLADRGLWAPWLFRRIMRLGWHPFLRINAQGHFQPTGAPSSRPLRAFVPCPGTRWRGTGVAFSKERRLPCTLLACWDLGPTHTDPWLILTDLPPDTSDACWYSLRAWIEQGFKITKRAGWQWHHTHMTAPARAARLWLAIAVATLWLLSVGGEAEAQDLGEAAYDPLPEVAQDYLAHRRQVRALRPRLTSIFRRGWALILSALLAHLPMPFGCFLPEPWRDIPTLVDPAALPREVPQGVVT